MTPREPPPAGPTLGAAHGGRRAQPCASPSLCASIIPISSGERPGSVPCWLPVDVSAPSHVLIPTFLGSPSPQGQNVSRQGKGIEGSVPSLILGWGHVGLLQSQPSLSPGLLCSSWAQLHILEPLTLVLAVTAVPVSAAGLCHGALPARGAELWVASAFVLPGQCQRGKGNLGGPSLVEQEWGGGPVFPRGSRSMALSPSCLCHSAAAALQSHVLGPQAAALGPPGEWGSPVQPSSGTGSCQGSGVT